MLLLAGDIGGTKTRLALVQDGVISERKTFVSAAYDSLEAIIVEFLETRTSQVSRACFGVAGPVHEDVCQTTNLKWIVDGRHIERTLGIPRVKLVNDFRAMAEGISKLPSSDFALLNDAPSDPAGPWVLIGAGTGLGEAAVIRTPTGHEVISSEGGHTDFAPRNEEEIELLRFLLRRHKRVSYERIVAGPGLRALYEFAREREPQLEGAAVRAEMDDGADVAAIVSRHGLANDDALCAKALSLFVSIYGAEAGNLALKLVARGGVYVAGGIAPKILPKLLDGTFRESFISKGRLSPMLEATPVKVVLNSDAGLLGAAALAAQLTL